MSKLFDFSSLAMIPSAYKDGKLYSIRPTDGSGDFTFSRGSNLAATRVDVNGLIEKGRENFLLQSNQFDTTWATTRASVVSGQLGYDGTNNAWAFIDNTANNTHLINQGITIGAKVATFSIYAKAGSRNFIAIRFEGNTGTDYAYFNLSNGTLGSVNPDYIEARITAVGATGWYRCEVTRVLASSSNQVVILSADADSDPTYIGNSDTAIYIQDAQVELGLVATDYIETGASTAQAGILEDLPRLDYSGSCPALLLEPQRTNFLNHGEYFGAWTLQAGGTGSAPVLEANTTDTLSPEGKYNAYKVTFNVGSGTTTGDESIMYRSKSGLTAGSDHTASVYLKGESGGEEVIVRDTEGSYKKWTLTTEWARYDYTQVAAAPSYATSFGIRQGVAGIINSDAVVYMYGFQSELGSYPTSYIPTYGSSVTRSVDAMANLDIPDFNDNTSFSVLLELTRNGISSSEIGSMFSFYNDSLTQQFWFHIDAPNAQVRLRDATNSNATMATLSFDTDDRKKIAFSCDGSTLKTYADGVLSNTYNLVNVFNVDELRTAAKSFDVHQIATFPTALTDSECIALTTL